MILHERNQSGSYDVGKSGDGTLLNREQLTQLVFEAAHRLGIWNFKCRDCSSWAQFKVQYKPQYAFFFVCSQHLTDEAKNDADIVSPIPAEIDSL